MFDMISPLEAVLLNYSFVLFLSSVFSAGHLYFFFFHNDLYFTVLF